MSSSQLTAEQIEKLQQAFEIATQASLYDLAKEILDVAADNDPMTAYCTAMHSMGGVVGALIYAMVGIGKPSAEFPTAQAFVDKLISTHAERTQAVYDSATKGTAVIIPTAVSSARH